MPKIQQGIDGARKITIPSDIAEGKNWKKGDDIGFVIVDEINRPQFGDIYLRKNR
ncbi:MAG TPA: hypothetical protein ACFYEK_17800 [Candidatus Wunengus sp. YC60]|uniref:hypothetical protein n=1 Tax=Candidatus Wunengus sp. YC60 TaxID=3367697 RepID=UPI004025FC06